MFFTKKQKELALSTTKSDLCSLYEDSEYKLKTISFYGNEEHLKTAMKQHREYEYAMLYQNTPAFRRALSRKKNRCVNKYKK